MKVYELMINVEFQNQIYFCYYDYDKEERIKITREEADYKKVRYIYSEDNEIFIEVEMEE